MADNKDIRQEHHKSMSNPEKSFEAGKKGGKASTDLDSRATNALNGSKIVDQNVNSSDEQDDRESK